MPRRKARMTVSEYPFLEKWFYEISFSCFFSSMLDCEKVLYHVVQMNRGKFQTIALLHQFKKSLLVCSNIMN